MLYMLRINFFISSLDQQLRAVATSEQGASLSPGASLCGRRQKNAVAND